MGKILNLLAAQGTHLGQEHKRQIVVLDSELDEMESEITTLKAENLRLKAKVNPLQKEVDRLKERMALLEVVWVKSAHLSIKAWVACR